MKHNEQPVPQTPGSLADAGRVLARLRSLEKSHAADSGELLDQAKSLHDRMNTAAQLLGRRYENAEPEEKAQLGQQYQKAAALRALSAVLIANLQSSMPTHAGQP